METVIFRADIARIVLRYLQDQRLENVSRKFCKTSPHLKEEFNAYKHGLKFHSFFPPLEDIICEYVKILGKVDQFMQTLPESIQNRLRDRTLSHKISELLKIPFENDFHSSSASSESSQQSSQSSNQVEKGLKRKRENISLNTTAISEIEYPKKKRRLSQKYCFLNMNPKNHDGSVYESTVNDTSDSEDQDQTKNIDISKIDMPKNESTPRIKTNKPKIVAKALPEITNAILENSEFQKRLVDNINEALSSANKTNENNNQTEQKSEMTQTVKENQITSSQLLDEMVKNILEATERDPSFDAIIQEVVNAPNTKDDCNDNNPVEVQKLQLTEPSEITEPNQTELENISNDISQTSSSVQTLVPRTPLIIRHAIVTAQSDRTTANSDTNTGSQPVSQLSSNNLLNMFSDSSLSISRLVSINTNDVTLKPGQTDQSIISIGNSTADHILSQLGNGGDTQTSNDEPILSDVGPNHMFPVFISNDGVITPITYYLNGSEVTLATNVAGNQILTSPIVVASAVEPTPSKIIATPLVSQNLDSKTQISNINDNEKNKSSLRENQNIEEGKTTPATSGIVNTKISKSLSTPRRTTPSHIRTLTFSPASSAAPLANSGATPLSTRRKFFDIQASMTKLNEVGIQPEDATAAEKPIIRNVEILPQLPLPATSTITATALGNDSSNSCSVPPLFAGEESSNQTVIKTELSLLEKSSSSILKDSKTETHNTPQRKQSRRTAVHRCKRQLSKSSNEGTPEIDAKATTKSIVETQKKDQNSIVSNEVNSKEFSEATKPGETKKEITLEDWKKLRSCTYNDLDARLREINATRVVIDKTVVKREIKKKPRAKKRTCRKGQSNTKLEQNDLNVSISSSEQNKSGDQGQQQQTQTNTVTAKYNEKTISTNELEKQSATSSATIKESQEPQVTAEVERRMANIGYLLETPFKDSITGGVSFVPPTPGVFLPSLDTPLSKARDHNELCKSESFLFGSLTKSEIGTPQLNAITPGFRFTPLVAKDTTPRSVAPTEYSSGGSYYKPDECEDLDRNIDKMLRDSAQKKRLDGIQQQYAESPLHSEQENQNETEIEIVKIPADPLKVAPLVLRRVKSFGQESTENLENEPAPTVIFAVDPHYALASGLPEVYSEKESPSSSSSSSNSSSSSSDSSESSSESEIEEGELKRAEDSIRPTLLSSLENLSDISSAEDEDWHKIEEKNKVKPVPEEDDIHLIDDHGELRFPLRSYLTPRKQDDVSNQICISSDTVVQTTLKSAEKIDPKIELELKRERMKEKLKQDTAPKFKAKVQRRPSTTCITKKQQQKITTAISKQQLPVVATETHDEANVDVLAALQLSAKKSKIATSNSVICEVTPSKMPPPALSVDDNAVSNIINAPPKIIASIPLASGIKTFFPAMTNPSQRKCVPIEALPSIKSSSRAKSKQIVRTPLGFKGASSTSTVSNPTSVTPTKTALIKFSPKTKNKNATSTSIDKTIGEKVRISPRLQATERQQTKKEINKAPLKNTKRKAAAKKSFQHPKENLEKKTSVVENQNASTTDPGKKAKKFESEVSGKSKQPLKEEAPATETSTKSRKKEKAVAKKSLPTKSDIKTKFPEINRGSEKKSKDNVQKAEIKQNVFENATDKDDDLSDDIEDPIAKCTCVTLDENDIKSFFSYVYDESEQVRTKIPTSPRSINETLNNFKMHIAINDDKKHTLTMSEKFCLFDQSPQNQVTEINSNLPDITSQSIRNIPKKRRVCIISNNDEVDSTKQIIKSNQTEFSKESSKKKQIEENSKSQLDSVSVATTLESNTKQLDISSTNPIVLSSTSKTPTDLNTKKPVSSSNHVVFSSTPKNSTDKIQIDDIESILSQLHDTGKS